MRRRVANSRECVVSRSRLYRYPDAVMAATGLGRQAVRELRELGLPLLEWRGKYWTEGRDLIATLHQVAAHSTGGPMDGGSCVDAERGRAAVGQDAQDWALDGDRDRAGEGRLLQAGVQRVS